MVEQEYRSPGMKKSTIKLVLRKKIKEWLNSIKDEPLQQYLAQNIIVTGGSIPSMLLGEDIKDYDIYFKTRTAVINIANYYVNYFNEKNGKLPIIGTAPCNPAVKLTTIKNIKGVEEERVVIYIQSSGVAGEEQEGYQYFEAQNEVEADVFATSIVTNFKAKDEGKYRPVYMSQNAITLSDKLQIVIRFYGNPEEIHKNFDFVHATGYYDYWEDNLQIPVEAYESLMSKALIYNGSLYPIASLFRIRKFIERGWRISAGQILKMIWQLNEVDLNDNAILQEQLIGVDQAYMYQLVQALRQAEGKIDATYIAKIIDNIFD